MNNLLSAIISLTLMTAHELQERHKPDETPNGPQPPWVTAKYDLPKSIRKGKTWEEIKEIKKLIWINQQLGGKLVCHKCGKIKDVKQEAGNDTTEFLITPKGIFCMKCVDEGEKKKSD